MARKKPKGAYYLLSGFFSDYNELYESDLRDFVRKNLNDDPTKKFQRFINILKH